MKGTTVPAAIDTNTGEIEIYDSQQGAMRIHAAESAEKAAKRAKNRSALESAIDEKLAAQRDFAAHYRGMYEGKPGPKVDRASTGANYCQHHGFSLRTVQRWCERLLDEAKFEVERYQRLAKTWALLEMEQAANFSSESVEWYTPEDYIKSVRACLGTIDLDPASSKTANRTVKAKRIYTESDDALKKQWSGKIFLNPPYGTERGESVAGLFCQKAVDEYRIGKVTEGILLINSVHSQRWQATLYDFPVCFVDHRIQFVSGDGEENKNPTFQNIFVYLGKRKNEFVLAFEQHGYCMDRMHV